MLTVRRPLVALVPLMVLSGCDGSAPGSAGTAPTAVAAATLQTGTFEEYAAGLAAQLGIDNPPKVEPIREVAPDDQGLRLQTQCMIDVGWPYQQDRDGGWVLELRAAQEDAFNLDSYVCQLQYPVAARYRQPWGEPQHRARYAYLVDDYLPCVRSHGYTVAEPPTFEVFVEGDAAGSPWVPSSEVLPQVLADIPERWASWDAFDDVCPQQTPLDELYPPDD